MSNKEKALQIIEGIPESKMVFVVDMLNCVKGLLVDEVEPDAWDLQMIAEAGEVNDGEKISLDELLKRDGLTYADIQD
jgi:hypothetical protein